MATARRKIRHSIAIVELLGPGLALIIAIIIFGLLLHFFENRNPDDKS